MDTTCGSSRRSRELPFAGHPTLGTAFSLVTEGRVSPTAVQTCKAGAVSVEVDLDARFAWMDQFPPVFGPPVVDRSAIARAAGLSAGDLAQALPIMSVSTGIPHLLVPVDDEAALLGANRNDASCVEVCAANEAESLYLFVIRGEGDVVARMFDRSLEIGEDPATGSAAGPLGAYLARHRLMEVPARFTIAQGEQVGRPSFLHVEVDRDDGSFAVRVGGGVQVVGSGSFVL